MVAPNPTESERPEARHIGLLLRPTQGAAGSEAYLEERRRMREIGRHAIVRNRVALELLAAHDRGEAPQRPSADPER